MAAHHWPARKQERCQNREASTGAQASLKLLSSLELHTGVLKSLFHVQGPGLGICEMPFMIRTRTALLWQTGSQSSCVRGGLHT